MESSTVGGVANRPGLERNFSRACRAIVVDDAEEVLYMHVTHPLLPTMRY